MPTPARTLVILRHAKAESGTLGDDQVRALALEGRKQAMAVGERLRESHLEPDLVLCSSALRTKQTWELIAHGLTVTPQVLILDELYAASVDDLMQAVHTIDPDVKKVLVVGHEPCVSAVASLLAGAGSDDIAVAQVRVGVPTATYSVLRSPLPWPEWQGQTVQLEEVVRG